MIESRFSLSLAAAVVCMSLGFANSATAADARRRVGRRRRHQGRRVHGLPRRERQQQQSGVAEPRRPERRLRARAARDVQGAQTHQRNHVSDRRSTCPIRISPMSPPISRRRRPPVSKPILPTGRPAKRCTSPVTPARNIPACTACHGPSGQGNRRRRLSRAARAAFGLHREAVAGLPHEESLP